MARDDSQETHAVRCPYCAEAVRVALEPDVEGELVIDCEVCCNPWRLVVRRRREGEVEIEVGRLDD